MRTKEEEPLKKSDPIPPTATHFNPIENNEQISFLRKLDPQRLFVGLAEYLVYVGNDR